MRPSRRRSAEFDERMPRAAERRKDLSGLERDEVSSLGMMYCILICKYNVVKMRAGTTLRKR